MYKMFWFYYYFVFIVYCLRNISAHQNKDKNCGELFLTVNAVHNLLEFNWDFTYNCEISPDALTLYYGNSGLITPKIDLETISLHDRPKGYHLSAIRFGKPNFPGNWNEDDKYPILGSHCYPFWLRSMHGEAIIDTVCIKIEPTWMENFGKLKIGKMVIPGTHDSGAWTGNQINIIKRYTFTQETNLWGQLVSGIRYFDIRVGLYKYMKPRLWINHGTIRCSRMEEEFQHIANFLKKAPNEVVILHFHSFEVPSNFRDKDHQSVLELIKRILGEFILPPGKFERDEGTTLEEIWATNKRLIVSYNDENQILKNDWLWNPIPHKWGNKIKPTDLYEYLKAQKSNHYHPLTPFCALMSVLTANAEYVIKNLDKSLRHLADEVNPLLNVWLRVENWTEDINIIATDFFMGNDVINIAIEANIKKLTSVYFKNNSVIYT